MWLYFPNIPTNGDILDVRRLNQNFEVVSQASAGGLGEHAWTEGFVNSASMMAHDIALRHTHKRTVRNPFLKAGWTQIELSQAWRDVDPAGVVLHKTIFSRGGQVYIEASFGLSNANSLAGVSPGLCVAILVDGEVRHESVIGSGDPSSDDLRAGAGYKFSTGALAPVVNSDGYAPAIRAAQTGVVLSCVVRLSPGRHRVSVGYRNPLPGDEPDSQYVTQGELNILEMWS